LSILLLPENALIACIIKLIHASIIASLAIMEFIPSGILMEGTRVRKRGVFGPILFAYQIKKHGAIKQFEKEAIRRRRRMKMNLPAGCFCGSGSRLQNDLVLQFDSFAHNASPEL